MQQFLEVPPLALSLAYSVRQPRTQHQSNYAPYLSFNQLMQRGTCYTCGSLMQQPRSKSTGHFDHVDNVQPSSWTKQGQKKRSQSQKPKPYRGHVYLLDWYDAQGPSNPVASRSPQIVKPHNFMSQTSVSPPPQPLMVVKPIVASSIITRPIANKPIITRPIFKQTTGNRQPIFRASPTIKRNAMGLECQPLVKIAYRKQNAVQQNAQIARQHIQVTPRSQPRVSLMQPIKQQVGSQTSIRQSVRSVIDFDSATLAEPVCQIAKSYFDPQHISRKGSVTLSHSLQPSELGTKEQNCQSKLKDQLANTAVTGFASEVGDELAESRNWPDQEYTQHSASGSSLIIKQSLNFDAFTLQNLPEKQTNAQESETKWSDTRRQLQLDFSELSQKRRQIRGLLDEKLKLTTERKARLGSSRG